jgi:hypothetical protein
MIAVRNLINQAPKNNLILSLHQKKIAIEGATFK